MRISSVRVPAILTLAALSLGSVAWRAPAPRNEAEGLREAVEIHRIRLHFDSVLAELNAAPLTNFSPTQLARRAALIETLGRYRDRGVFPHNYDFPGRAVPYFVDRKTGTLCAVAHLLASTGRRDIVDRVAAANNNVYVPELATDTAFDTWLTQNGITLEEAARIQVPYLGDPPTASVTSRPRNNAAYKFASTAAIGSALYATVWNLRPNRDGHGRIANVLGATVGVAALGLGVARMGYRDAPPGLAVANVVAGAGSAWVSARGILRHRHTVAAARDAARVRESAEVSLTPIVVPSPTGSASAGVSIAIRF